MTDDWTVVNVPGSERPYWDHLCHCGHHWENHLALGDGCLSCGCHTYRDYRAAPERLTEGEQP